MTTIATRQDMISEKQRQRVKFLCLKMEEISGLNPMQRTRKRDIVCARMIVAFALRLDGNTLMDIGELLGVDHSTAAFYEWRMRMILNTAGYNAERELWEKFKKEI